jgi:radical SAM/Cys-rich protein
MNQLPMVAAETAETSSPDFNTVLRRHGIDALRRRSIVTVQVNVGKLCNQACHHCHVDAGPTRREIMNGETADRVIALLGRSPGVEVVDLTGGAPELNPHFQRLVEAARSIGKRVIVRCNLTVLFVEGMEDLPQLYCDNEVELVCSLPCYTAENVDAQRGRGVFERSIEALRILNERGYGRPGSHLPLDLVYNPGGAFLPPEQGALEAKYRDELRRLFGIEFRRLLTITNMPIKRFADQLRRWGKYDEYMALLVNHFNPRVAGEVMCRDLLSVGWEGTLYDCDFNQMLELPIVAEAGCSAASSSVPTIWDIERIDDLVGKEIVTASHCLGCTAGAGSSCGGVLG